MKRPFVFLLALVVVGLLMHACPTFYGLAFGQEVRAVTNYDRAARIVGLSLSECWSPYYQTDLGPGAAKGHSTSETRGTTVKEYLECARDNITASIQDIDRGGDARVEVDPKELEVEK